MPDLVKKEICGIFETKNGTDDSKYKYAHSDLMGNIIKNCRGVKILILIRQIFWIWYWI